MQEPIEPTSSIDRTSYNSHSLYPLSDIFQQKLIATHTHTQNHRTPTKELPLLNTKTHPQSPPHRHRSVSSSPVRSSPAWRNPPIAGDPLEKPRALLAIQGRHVVPEPRPSRRRVSARATRETPICLHRWVRSKAARTPQTEGPNSEMKLSW